ncbi:MAG: OmpA family protein [Burkholderiales bacterium]|nr:OmpA family protein [Burkholderiales bacterium]
MSNLSPILFKRKWLALTIATVCCASGVLAQSVGNKIQFDGEESAAVSEDLRYIGAPFKVGIGYQSGSMWRGDLFWAFHETDNTAWLGEIYGTTSSAAGGRLSFHWQPADDKEASVRKLFTAFDQNRWHDRKVTLGGGLENEHWFGSAYGSAGISGRREVSDRLFSVTETQTGVENNHVWSQDVTTTTYTRIFERAYDWGIGARVGRFHDDLVLRWFGGVDYEWGENSTSQITGTLGIEKYFVGTPHSVALVGEIYHKRGDYEVDKNDQRIMAMYRYSFGGPSYRPAKRYRDVQEEIADEAVKTQVATASADVTTAAQQEEKRMIKTTATAESDVFFKFDSAELQPQASRALDEVVDKLKNTNIEGNIYVTGHTCNIGSAAYNQKLSERRAASVKRYLVGHGIDENTLLVEGKGLHEPRYPNDKTGRPKNRRVDIEFVTYEENAQTPETAATIQTGSPRIEWRREEIAEEPAWVRRALRSPVQHKQTVDVYRTEESVTTVVEGDRVVENQLPIARDDYAIAGYNKPVNVDVLANDTDPDGDELTIVSFAQPRNGTVTLNGNIFTYRARDGYIGYDTFQYTIEDGYGGSATATVTVFADP